MGNLSGTGRRCGTAAVRPCRGGDVDDGRSLGHPGGGGAYTAGDSPGSQKE